MNLSGRGSTDAAISFINAISDGVKERRAYQFDLAQKKLKRDQELEDAKTKRNQALFDLKNKREHEEGVAKDKEFREIQKLGAKQGIKLINDIKLRVEEQDIDLSTVLGPEHPISDPGQVDHQTIWNRGIRREERIENTEGKLEALRAEDLKNPGVATNAIKREERKLKKLLEQQDDKELISLFEPPPQAPQVDISTIPGEEVTLPSLPKTREQILQEIGIATQAEMTREAEQAKTIEQRKEDVHTWQKAEHEWTLEDREFLRKNRPLIQRKTKLDLDTAQLAYDKATIENKIYNAITPEDRIAADKEMLDNEAKTRLNKRRASELDYLIAKREYEEFENHKPDAQEQLKMDQTVKALNDEFNLKIDPIYRRSTLDMPVLTVTLDLFRLHQHFNLDDFPKGVNAKDLDKFMKGYAGAVREITKDKDDRKISMGLLSDTIREISGLDDYQSQRVIDFLNQKRGPGGEYILPGIPQ